MPRSHDDVSTMMRVSSPRGGGRAYRLVSERGPDAGLSTVLARAYLRTLVGTSQACHVRLTDRQVSRRHLALETTSDGLRVSDLGSTNGTFVGGVRIESALLIGGEKLTLGGTVLGLERIAEDIEPALSGQGSFGRVVGESPQMRELYALCEVVAATDLPLLIEGETGTGKEVLAESIHEASARRAGPFVVFDCTSVPTNLAESELFGHERGAFTGAVAQRQGVFEQADGGTLFIDEIGDLDTSVQPKLLRALERGEVRRVGGNEWVRVDARVVCATRRNMDQEVQDGRFRDDLFFRLAVTRLELPPLRDRSGDIAVLTRRFWQELGGGKSPPYELVQRFERLPWPGNVRELRNAVSRRIVLGEKFASPPASKEATRTPGKRGDPLQAILEQDLPYPRARDLAQDEFERRYLERVLALHGGSVAKAAAASGVARRYFNLILARNRR